MTVTTLRTERPVAPDRDWEALRASAMVLLARDAPDWTDHNVSDPGVTIAEAVAWGLADLHYRTQNVPLDGWSAETGLWRAEGSAHWNGTVPTRHTRLLALAGALRDLAPADVAKARAATYPGAAAGALIDAQVPADVAAAAVRLLRAPSVLRAALDGAALVEEVRGQGDDDAIGRLRLDPVFDRLWDDELRAVLRRTRRRHAAREIRRRTAELRRAIGDATTAAGATAGVERVAGDVLVPGDTAQRNDVLAVHPAPPGAVPEQWETATGRTTAWPPHPLQARTVEPVTADDYARLARGVAGVRRAWAVPGVLRGGVGWDGKTVAITSDRLGAITLVCEPVDQPASESAKRTFLRNVLRNAVGREVEMPFAPLHTALGEWWPRRMLCDEVGAALLGTCEVTLRGVLHVAATADREDALDAALERVRALFRTGRPETAPEAVAPRVLPRDLDGPWPPPPPMPEGWTPGDPVRVTEIVQALSADPEIYGVEALEARADGAWQSYELVLDPACVPVLADQQCVSVRLDLVEGCSGAC